MQASIYTRVCVKHLNINCMQYAAVYGANTGFGKFAELKVEPDEIE